MSSRKERMRSIFDSDDSDDDDDLSGISHSYFRDDDEANKLRKTIEDVCSSLSNENEKAELDKSKIEPVPSSSHTANEKIPHLQDNKSTSEVEKGNSKKDIFSFLPEVDSNTLNFLSDYDNVKESKEIEKSLNKKDSEIELENVQINLSQISNNENNKNLEINKDPKKPELKKIIIQEITDSEFPKDDIILDNDMNLDKELIPHFGRDSPESNDSDIFDFSKNRSEDNLLSKESLDTNLISNIANKEEKVLVKDDNQVKSTIEKDDLEINISDNYLSSKFDIPTLSKIDISQKSNKISSPHDRENIQETEENPDGKELDDFKVNEEDEPNKLENDNSLIAEKVTTIFQENNLSEVENIVKSSPKSEKYNIISNKIQDNHEIIDKPEEDSNNLANIDKPEQDSNNLLNIIDKPVQDSNSLTNIDEPEQDSNNLINIIDKPEQDSNNLINIIDKPEQKSNNLINIDKPEQDSNISKNIIDKSEQPNTTHLTDVVNTFMPSHSLFEDGTIAAELDSQGDDDIKEKRKKVRVEDVFTDSEAESVNDEKVTIGSKNKSLEGEVTKKVRKKRSRATSINLPAIMLAFEKGWIREVVFRSTLQSFNNRADVYYYTPDGKKLRSTVEVEDYIVKNKISDLTTKNFSFFKEPLGVEERYEKIRNAAFHNSSGSLTASNLDGTNKENIKKARKQSEKKTKGPPPQKKPKGEFKKVNGKKVVRIGALQNAENYPISQTDRPVYATHLFPCNPPLSQPRIITPLLKGVSKDKTFHCTPSCSSGGGSVPNLQCVKCVCLFHSECCDMPSVTVALILSSVAKFLCPNCYREERENFNEKQFTTTPSYEPLSFDPPGESEDEGFVTDFEHPSYKRVSLRPPIPQANMSSNQFNTSDPTPLAIPNFATPAHVPSGMFTIPPASNVPQFMLIPPSNQANNMAAKSVLLSQSPMNSSLPLPNQPPATFMNNSNTSTLYSQISLREPMVKKKSLIPVKEKDFLQGGKYFMENISKAYHLLRKIFSFLSVTDLLVVSRVCLLWRDLALGPSFWSTVRLRNVCVKDWDKMVQFLERRGTNELDMRKMVLHIRKEFTIKTEIDIDKEFGTDKNTELMETEEFDGFTTKNNKSDDENEKLEVEKLQKESKDDDKHSVENESKLQNKIQGSIETEETFKHDSNLERSMETEEASKDDSKLQEGNNLDKGTNNTEMKEKREKIVTSVLSEHDYFGQVKNKKRKRKRSHSSDSSSSSIDSEESRDDDSNIPTDTHKTIEEETLQNKSINEKDEDKITSPKSVDKLRESPRKVLRTDKESIDGQKELKQDSPIATLDTKEIMNPLHKEWTAIAKSLSNLRSLTSVVIGSCEPAIVEIILHYANSLTSVTALNLIPNYDTDNIISFDPSFLMHTKQLRELRLGSKQNFIFKSNFNFIKLPNLQRLMLKGLKTAETGWPYMGTQLTHLHLSCINTFSHNNWLNLASMTELVDLELDGNGADLDSEICQALHKLTKLTKLALLDWNIGPKLPFVLKKLQVIKSLYVVPASESLSLRGIYAGRLMVVLDSTKHLEEFIWGIQPASRFMDETSGEKIYIQNMKPGKETGVMEGEEVRAIAIDSLKGFVKCRIPQTKVTVKKVAASNWISGEQGWNSFY